MTVDLTGSTDLDLGHSPLKSPFQPSFGLNKSNGATLGGGTVGRHGGGMRRTQNSRTSLRRSRRLDTFFTDLAGVKKEVDKELQRFLEELPIEGTRAKIAASSAAQRANTAMHSPLPGKRSPVAKAKEKTPKRPKSPRGLRKVAASLIKKSPVAKDMGSPHASVPVPSQKIIFDEPIHELARHLVFLETIKGYAEEFIATSPSELICNFAARNMIERVKRLQSCSETERTLTVQLLYHIAKCSRFEEYLSNETSARKPANVNPLTKSMTHVANILLSSMTDVSEVLGQTSLGQAASGGAKLRPSKLLNEANKMNRSRALSVDYGGAGAFCRICDRQVYLKKFRDHTEICAKKTEWEIRSLECNDLFRKYNNQVNKEYKTYVCQVPDAQQSRTHVYFYRTAKELSSKARKNRGERCIRSLDGMLAQLQEIPVEELDLDQQQLYHDLESLLTFKKQAWQSIVAASTFLRGMYCQLSPRGVARREHIMGSTRRPCVGDFEIIKPITKGGFARVYLAKKNVTGDYFAVKVLKKQDMVEKNQVDNVIAERNILATVSCPYVVRLYYSFQTNENLCLAMEFLQGGDLFSLLSMMGCFDEETAKFYVAETILALDYLHQKDVIHRDLKPDNILINGKGHIKLTDFGLSHAGLNKQTQEFWNFQNKAVRRRRAAAAREDAEKEEEEEDFLQSPRESGDVEAEGIVGTPDYLAPEVLLGLGHGRAVDYWALGVMLYEFLVGFPTFTGNDPAEVFENIICGDIAWPEGDEALSDDAVDLISRLLHSNPQERLGANGADEVKNHPFFEGINWGTLLTHSAPPFVPSAEVDNTSYFEAREEFWPLMEEDFGFSNGSVAESSTEDLGQLDLFGDFWCINVDNLKARNQDLVKEWAQAAKKAVGLSVVSET